MDQSKDKYDEEFESESRLKNELIPEEFPEGPVGSPIHEQEPVKSKSTPFKAGQKRMSAFVYPAKDRHDHLPRQAPGAHPLHDQKMKEEQDT